MRNLISPFLLVLIFSSCEKEETPIIAPERGDVKSDQVLLETDYRNQIFYSLDQNQIISSNLKTDWDLAFENGTTGWHIFLNTSKGMAVWNTEQTDFSAITSSSNAEWNWDNNEGHIDSTAFGDYRNNNNVYVIDRGYSYTGNHTGYRKIQILSQNNTEYTVKYAKLDGSDEQNITFQKEISSNFTCLSFNTHQVESIQPISSEWDLLFTQYTHLFDDTPPTPYLVTGILTNRNLLVAEDTILNFDDITYNDISNLNFTNEINTIGYDWKVYNYADGIFEIIEGINYIIQANSGYYYKLRIIDFYDNSGNKGSPLFEYQRL